MSVPGGAEEPILVASGGFLFGKTHTRGRAPGLQRGVAASSRAVARVWTHSVVSGGLLARQEEPEVGSRSVSEDSGVRSTQCDSFLQGQSLRAEWNAESRGQKPLFFLRSTVNAESWHHPV